MGVKVGPEMFSYYRLYAVSRGVKVNRRERITWTRETVEVCMMGRVEEDLVCLSLLNDDERVLESEKVTKSWMLK